MLDIRFLKHKAIFDDEEVCSFLFILYIRAKSGVVISRFVILQDRVWIQKPFEERIVFEKEINCIEAQMKVMICDSNSDGNDNILMLLSQQEKHVNKTIIREEISYIIENEKRLII